MEYKDGKSVTDDLERKCAYVCVQLHISGKDNHPSMEERKILAKIILNYSKTSF